VTIEPDANRSGMMRLLLTSAGVKNPSVDVVSEGHWRRFGP